LVFSLYYIVQNQTALDCQLVGHCVGPTVRVMVCCVWVNTTRNQQLGSTVKMNKYEGYGSSANSNPEIQYVNEA